GKPTSLEEAVHTLTTLSDQEHQVITGVCLAQGPVMSSFSTITTVRFKPMTPADIEYYVQSYEVLDKAGSYGIQDWIGITQIAHINGSYTNIMGLPTTALYQALNVFVRE
ncbi:UNVERIFIED_CONTAM: hypothetical protein GTU68_045718, partial [Idotea baltica]|nr:hypothetical protein [Idotea baltica]